MRKVVSDFTRNRIFAAFMAVALVVILGVPATLAVQTATSGDSQVVGVDESTTLPECNCGTSTEVNGPFDHEATCNLNPGNMSNEQAYAVWSSYSDEEKAEVDGVWFTAAQWAYIFETALNPNQGMGKYATFNFAEYGIVNIDDSPTGVDVTYIAEEDLVGELVLTVENYAIDVVGGLWYKVAPVEGYEAPEVLKDNPWVLYSYYIDSEDTPRPLTFVDLPSTPSLTASVGGITVTVESDELPLDGRLALELVADLDPSEFGIADVASIAAALDIKVLKADETEWQPGEGEIVELTFESESLGLSDGEWFDVLHIHKDSNGAVTVDKLGPFVSSDNKATFAVDGFSIYVVVGTYSNDWNHNNYQITMTAGSSLEVQTTTNGNGYAWEFVGGDTSAFSLSNTNSRTATITANGVGEATLQCTITTQYNWKTTETMVVKALASVGNSAEDDIIFANIDKAYGAGDTEYENSYGPYVMKIRFEDTAGNVLKYADGTTVGDDYYVFDSDANIDINTFAASAPDGYTYAGAYFYWAGHFDGDKVYVTNVDRSTNVNYGSYLWYSGTHSTSGSGRWAYQASGVLHIIYAPVDEVYEVVFKDHCGYQLANYALSYNDWTKAAAFPSGYVDNIQNMADSLIPAHHASHDPGCAFSNTWVVTGGGTGIDGTYTTSQLKSKITGWKIKRNITVTAQCSEPDVTINYEVVGPDGSGTVDPAIETLKVVSDEAAGSTATAGEGYKFVGWFKDPECTQPVDASLVDGNGKFVPAKVGGKNVAATYYAKFERATTTLTVSKVVSGVSDVDDVFLFDVYRVVPGEAGSDSMVHVAQIAIPGAGDVTLTGLFVGDTYKVIENTGWSWRYQLDSITDPTEPTRDGVITLSATPTDNKVIFTNSVKTSKWLDFSGWCENLFKGAGIYDGFGIGTVSGTATKAN